MYGYQTVSNTSVTSGTTTVTVPAGMTNPVTATAPSGDWYSVVAVGDPDGDKIESGVFACSVTNQLIIQGDGD